MSVYLQEQFMTSMHESNEEIIDKESKNLNESMQEIDRKLFASLNKEGDGHYYILVDGYYEQDFYADSDEEAKEKFRQWINRDKTNNVAESCGNKSRKKLKEARWDYTLKCGPALRTAIHDVNVQEVINQLWAGYKELLAANIIDDWQYDSYTEDLIGSEYWDEDELEENIDWALNNFYDLCDNTNVWIPLNEELITEQNCENGNPDELNESFNPELWNKLSGPEQYAAEYALGLIKDGCPVDDAVSEAVHYINNANAESEYEDEDFYEDEVDYSKVMDFIKNYEGLNESLGADYSNVPEVTSINYNNGVRRGLPGITNMTAFITALEEVGKPEFKIRTSRFPLSRADIKDEWMSLQRNGWSISQTWDSSLPGFGEIYICQKK